MEKKDKELKAQPLKKTLMVVFSYHHNNTEKIAKVFSKILDAQIKIPHQVNPEELERYDLVGFGSGIYSDRHHQSLLDLIDKLPKVSNKKAFLFSTCGAAAVMNGQRFDQYTVKSHAPLKDKLQNKGYIIVDGFNCAGFNTNGFLKVFGGLNKGRPNTEDLKNAEEFAENLKEKM